MKLVMYKYLGGDSACVLLLFWLDQHLTSACPCKKLMLLEIFKFSDKTSFWGGTHYMYQIKCWPIHHATLTGELSLLWHEIRPSRTMWTTDILICLVTGFSVSWGGTIQLIRGTVIHHSTAIWMRNTSCVQPIRAPGLNTMQQGRPNSHGWK